MPAGLLDQLRENEIMDLLAYVLSGGLLPPREERVGERRVVGPNRKPLSPTLSPFVPHGEREKIGVSPQQCLTKWRVCAGGVMAVPP
jgi:hypothetical protein